MIRILSIFILLITTDLCLAQQQAAISANSSTPSIQNSLEDETIQNQQINKDEGYGPDDEEYYNAEGVNAEDPK